MSFDPTKKPTSLNSNGYHDLASSQYNRKKSSIATDKKISCALSSQLCVKFMSQGHCNRGQKCHFAHGVNKLKLHMQEQKRNVNCINGDECIYLPVKACGFKHDNEDKFNYPPYIQAIKTFNFNRSQLKKKRNKGEVKEKIDSELNPPSEFVEAASLRVANECGIHLLNPTGDPIIGLPEKPFVRE